MNKLLGILAAACLVSATGLKAEGIVFENGSWKEILAKAKTENKLVFIDVYTSWCGPCKKMAAEVFPLKEVGDRFNTNFINYKIDAEKGEGIQVAKTYNVKSYPTYLFVNGNGELVYRTVGYMEAGKFLKEADIAKKEQSDPKPFSAWEDEYNAGKREKSFLMGYLKKRSALGMASPDVIENVLPLLTEKELADKQIISLFMHYNADIAFVPNGKFYNYVIKHRSELDSILGTPGNRSVMTLQMGIRGYFRNYIIPSDKEELLPAMIQANDHILQLLGNEDKGLSGKRITMDYYSGTHNKKKLIAAALDYVNNGLFKMDIAALQRQDAEDYAKMKEPYLNGQLDSSKVEGWDMVNRFSSKRRIMGFTFDLRAASEAIYQEVDDKSVLNQAAQWVKRAMDMFPHFSTEAVYAGLLMKTGQIPQAVEIMQKAAEDPALEVNPDLRKLLLHNKEKIEAGLSPEHLWHL